LLLLSLPSHLFTHHLEDINLNLVVILPGPLLLPPLAGVVLLPLLILAALLLTELMFTFCQTTRPNCRLNRPEPLTEPLHCGAELVQHHTSL
jgi:hypothetical protein